MKFIAQCTCKAWSGMHKDKEGVRRGSCVICGRELDPAKGHLIRGPRVDDEVVDLLEIS